MWLHHHLVFWGSVITLSLIYITTFLTSSRLCLCYCLIKYRKYENSDFESLLQMYILALYSCLTWSNQTLVCAVLGQRCALPRHTAPPPPRTVNAPFHAVWMKKETQKEKKREREKEQLMMKRHEAGSGAESRHRVDPLMWSRSRCAGVPVLRSAPRLFVTETRAGFRVFPLNEAAAPEGDSFGSTHRWTGSVLMLRFLCRVCAVRVYSPAGLNHLLFAGWCCGSHWSHTDGAHLFFIFLICLLSSFISSGLCESANNTDGIIPPGIIIHCFIIHDIWPWGAAVRVPPLSFVWSWSVSPRTVLVRTCARVVPVRPGLRNQHHAGVRVGARVPAGGAGGLELSHHLLLHLQDDQLQEHRLPAGGGQYDTEGGGDGGSSSNSSINELEM